MCISVRKRLQFSGHMPGSGGPNGSCVSSLLRIFLH